MGKRCKYCLKPLEETSDVCAFCKIDNTKSKRDLEKHEKLVAYFCRGIRVIGFLVILYGILMTFSFVGLLLPTIGKNMITTPVIVFASIMSLFGIFSIFLGVGLRRYYKWSFWGGAILFSLSLILSILSLNIIGILFNGLFLYYTVNRTSRKILLHKL
ncbi:MAG: hypothetical protein ISS92_02840 [Candidatus Omnitrophica bacterium]|nr:hypothetical protein [Candidatus Omnitrophota bacterium]